MAILYVASEALELEPLAHILTGLRKLKWPIDYAFEGIWEGRRVMLAANGAGPKLAVRAVETAIRAVSAAELSASKLEAVVSTGLCGALDPNLNENDIVVATEVLNSASDDRYACARVLSERNFASGKVVTQDRIAITTNEKSELARSGAMAVDMEAAGVAARSKRAGLPFACIKVVSDRADESFDLNLNEMRSKDGRIARGKIGVYALKHPNKIAGLLRLKRRAQGAAQVLGEFLVSCRVSPVPDNAGPAE
jgi:adenosylhomocysteine nucleosidase